MCDANKPAACEGTPAPCSGQRTKSVASRGGRATSAQPPCAGSAAPAVGCLGATANPIKLGSMNGSSITKKSPVKECNGEARKSPVKQECTGGATQKSPVKQECTGAAAKQACTGGAAKQECNGNAAKQQCAGTGEGTKQQKQKSCTPKKEGPAGGVKAKRVSKPASAELGKVIKRGAARGLCVPVNRFPGRTTRTRTAPVRFGIDDDHVNGLAVAKAKTQGKKAVGKKAKKAKKV